MSSIDTKKYCLTVALVAGGKWHDIDFAREQLLRHLGTHPELRVSVFQNFDDVQSIIKSDFILSYTCDIVPSVNNQRLLRDYIAHGGKWFALHGTNSILEFMEDGRVDTPDWAPLFMELLGSSFAAHPPIEQFRVTVAQPEHELVKGIEDFDVVDEMYLVNIRGPIETLLETEYEGKTPRFSTCDWEKSKHPVFYLHRHGSGAVLYLTLGHCRGHYDMQPLMDYYPNVERCAWDYPIYHELLRRGISWAAGTSTHS